MYAAGLTLLLIVQTLNVSFLCLYLYQLRYCCNCIGAHVGSAINVKQLCRMLAEYIAASPGSSVSEAVQLLSGPPLVRLVHTKEGAQVACAVITYGTAKDRKKAMKGLVTQEDNIIKMTRDEFGHVVLMCILDTVDDTALLKKQILPGLLVSYAKLAS